MGTNFYTVSRGYYDNCLVLGTSWRDGLYQYLKGNEVLHIGKSSMGWCFALRIHPRIGITDLASWSPWLMDPSRIILNEYSEEISFISLYERITDRKGPGNSSRDPSWLRSNHAQVGPAGLARHTIGVGCVAHGDGTYDLVEGEFS